MLANARFILLVMLGPIIAGVGCAKVAVEGGDKPIHIVMDINIKIDRDLDSFFAYEAGATTHPTSAAATGQ
jgi:hypothetical protein